MNQPTKASQTGFTLIELLLAMTGIAFLLLFVVFGVMHVTALYSKGVSIRNINQSGRQLMEDVSRDIRYGGVVRQTNANRLCVGEKSYIWNPSTGSSTPNLYDDPVKGNPPVAFVVAQGTSYCDDVTKRIPTSAEPVVSPLIMLQELSVTQPNPTHPIYDIRLVVSTSGANVPMVTTSGGANSYQCSAIFGQFCAFGEFTTSIYARRTN